MLRVKTFLQWIILRMYITNSPALLSAIWRKVKQQAQRDAVNLHVHIANVSLREAWMFTNRIQESGLLIAPSPKTASDARIIRFMKRTRRRRLSSGCWMYGNTARRTLAADRRSRWSREARESRDLPAFVGPQGMPPGIPCGAATGCKVDARVIDRVKDNQRAT